MSDEACHPYNSNKYLPLPPPKAYSDTAFLMKASLYLFFFKKKMSNNIDLFFVYIYIYIMIPRNSKYALIISNEKKN